MGKELAVVLERGRAVVVQVPASLLILPLGKFSNFNTSLGFSRGHNLPVSHSAYSPSALLEELRHFQRSQRASLAWLDIYTGMFLSEGRGMAFSAGKPEHCEFCFLLKSFRAHFLRPIHNLKITIFINLLTNP